MKALPIAITIISLSLLAGFGISYGDNDEGESRFKARATVAPVQNATYARECGSCHMAYPPGLLPQRSWDRIMNTLDKHFGDNAELEPAIARDIRQYLAQNSADHADYRRSRAINHSLTPQQVPLRISETPYIKRKHREIPARLITGNKEVRSMSNCQACHRSTDKGIFNEHSVKIPGYGRWDD